MGKQEHRKSIELFNKILSDIEGRNFAPFYLFMGSEPYYADIIIEKIESEVLTPEEQEFNQFILYGNEVTAERVVEIARRYPMFSSHLVIVVKEAQLLPSLDPLIHYFNSPSNSTLLALSFTGKSIDARTSLYKSAQKGGVIFRSSSPDGIELYDWVENYLSKKGFTIEHEAALLLAEYCGNELRKLALELDKLVLALGSDERVIKCQLIEKNKGISRNFALFEFTKALSNRDRVKALTIATRIAASPKEYHPLQVFTAIFNHFVRVLKFHGADLRRERGESVNYQELVGIRYFQLQEYTIAARNYSLIQTMRVIALLREYDSRFKDSLKGEASDEELLLELVYKIVV